MTRYFHGGTRGLQIGAFVLPPSETGAKCASDYGAGHVHRRDRVYITTDFTAAVMFAAFDPSGKGVVYLVEPIGACEHDPDCDQPGLSYQCEKAKILRVMLIKTRKLAKVRRAILSDSTPFSLVGKLL